MFDDTLLDSAPSHAPILRSVHWIIALGAAVGGYFLGNYALPLLSAGADPKVISMQSGILGVLVGCYALMLCYVYADCRHLGFSAGVWLTLTLLLYVVGFLIYLFYSASKTGNWKRATIPVAYIFEIILVGCLILYPLLVVEGLPKSSLMVSLTAPPPPPPPPPPPAAAPPKVPIHRVTVEDIMKAPTVIPKTIRQVKDEPEPPPQAAAGVVGGVPGGVPGGSAGGVLGGIIGGVGNAPPPPPPPKAATPKRIRVGGQVESAKLIFKPQPEYPPLAKMARIQGTVRLEAIISKDGTIQDLKVIQGHPLLVKAALEAVQRWRYQPTLLNGDPVEVVTEIDVNYTLAE